MTTDEVQEKAALKIRLSGTPEDIVLAVDRLKKDFRILHKSNLQRNTVGDPRYFRLYLETSIKRKPKKESEAIE